MKNIQKVEQFLKESLAPFIDDDGHIDSLNYMEIIPEDFEIDEFECKIQELELSLSDFYPVTPYYVYLMALINKIKELYRIDEENINEDYLLPDEDFVLEFPSQELTDEDAEFEKERKVLEEKGLRWRFVASMDRGKTKVSLETVAADHPFYQLEGSNNIVLITTERYHDYPMMIRGYGAGASVTAAGVFANVMAVSN